MHEMMKCWEKLCVRLSANMFKHIYLFNELNFQFNTLMMGLVKFSDSFITLIFFISLEIKRFFSTITLSHSSF